MDDWIPVSERLPEDCEIVFVTTQDLSGANRHIEKAIRQNGVWVSMSDFKYPYIEVDRMAKVVAWMPRLKPYEG